MSTTLHNAIENAKDVIESAKGGAEHAASSTRSRIVDVTKFFVEVASTLRGFGLDDALGYLGLARKRTVVGSVAIFGAGVVVGAGIGVMFAPMSGESLRRAILRALDELKREASDTIEKAGEEVKQVERKIEKKVGDVAGAVKSTIDVAEDNFKEALSDTPPDASAKSTTASRGNHGEGGKAQKPHSGSESGRPLS